MKNYKINVSEPWDYVSKDNTNLIQGQIIEVLSPYHIIFKSQDELSFKNHTGNILVLKPRYKDQLFTIENNYQGTVCGGLLLASDYNKIIEEHLEENCIYVLIGGLLIDW
jgi:hypothetical protein